MECRGDSHLNQRINLLTKAFAWAKDFKISIAYGRKTYLTQSTEIKICELKQYVTLFGNILKIRVYWEITAPLP